MLKRGIFLADRYEIIDQIGTGGMSDVYKAKDHTLGRYVAIKVLKAEFSEDMTFVTKFRTEAQSAAVLEHPNIVNIYDVGSENGLYYIVMEYVEGITLKTYIEKKGQLNYRETLSIAIQVARGIQAAHAKNIIHRDIKPQNIIISTDGKVKVTDFGIARAVTEHTIHSDVMGSVHYVSPEQARNGYVSNKSDIYSLGIVIYEMVSGRVPFDGDSTVAVAIKHLQEEMVPPSTYAEDLPISLEKIILKCTQKSPDRRYDSIDSLLVDLRKSLVSPNEDFVSLVPFDQSKTRVISEDEVRQIQNQAADTEGTAAQKESNLQQAQEELPEDVEEEEESGRFLNSKMEKVVSIMRIVIAVIIILIVIYILGSFFDIFKFSGHKKDNDNQPSSSVSEEVKETVTMIELKGKTLSEAEAELKALGLTISESKTEASEEYEKGQIMDQDVKAGEKVQSGTVIYVTVSSGPDEEIPKETSVPDVTGKDADTAMQTLSASNLKVNREFEYSNDVEAGKVIRQNPSGGAQVEEGTTVTIYVSQGSESVKVPNVAGKTESDAKAALKSAGLKCGSVSTEYSNDVEEGNVISQSVASGKYAEKGSSVDLVVSKGPKESTYRYSARISTSSMPSDVTVNYADIELYGKSGDLLDSWSGVTKFPYSLSVFGIKEDASGNLVITWHYTDADGEEQTSVQERAVNFTASN